MKLHNFIISETEKFGGKKCMIRIEFKDFFSIKISKINFILHIYIIDLTYDNSTFIKISL